MKQTHMAAADTPVLRCGECRYWHIPALSCGTAHHLAGAAQTIEARKHYALCALCHFRHPSNMDCEEYGFIALNIRVFGETTRRMREVLENTFSGWVGEIAAKDTAYRRLEYTLAAMARAEKG